jgi:hypothetical protein
MLGIGDIVEIIVDIPKNRIASGKHDAISHQYDPETFEVDSSNPTA